MMINTTLQNEFLTFVKDLFPGEFPIPLHAPRFSEKEKELVFDALDTTYVSTVGMYVSEFEKQIAFEKNAQLEQYSTIYFKKINKNSIISEK